MTGQHNYSIGKTSKLNENHIYKNKSNLIIIQTDKTKGQTNYVCIKK